MMRSTPLYAPDGMAGYGGDAERFAGVRRDYTMGDVDRLAGSFRVRHTLAEMGATRLWQLLKSESIVPTLGAVTADEAVRHVRAGLKAIFISGGPVAGGEMHPVASVPKIVRSINDALRECDQIAESEGDRDGTYWMAPIIAEAEAVFGGPLNAYEQMRNLIAAGAAGVHFDDHLASEKKCGNPGGKVLVPISQHIRTLNAARLAADVGGVNTVLLCRTDAQSAQLLTSDIDERDRPFIGTDRTAEGFFRTKPGCGDDYAIARALAYAPYADLLWCETSEPDLRAAERFANEIHKQFPGKMLAYNCSPSIKFPADKIAAFQCEIAKMGYRFQFVTLAGFHSLDLPMFNLSRGYKERGMESYRELQQSEFGAEPEGYQEADMGYFDTVSTTTSGRTSFAGSRTNTQFHDYGIVQAHERHDDGLVHNHTWAASEAFSDSSDRLDDYAAVQAHERHDDGLVHGHSWAASGSFAGSKARFHDHRAVPVHEWHDEGLVHNHEWAVSGK